MQNIPNRALNKALTRFESFQKRILFATLRHPTFKCTHYKIQYQSGKHSTRRTVFLPITRMGLLSSILL